MTGSRDQPGEIAELVREVLVGMKRTSDLTDRVFLRIEADPGWLRYYHDLVNRRRKETVNRTIGRLVKIQTGARSGSRERNPRSKLIKTGYSRLYW